MLSFVTGDVDYAGHVAGLMLSQATILELGESTGWAQYFLGLAAYLRNHLSVAEAHFSTVDPYASHAVPAKQTSYGLAWICQAQGRPDEAQAAMDVAASIVSDLNLPYGPEVRLLRARLAALSGRDTGGLVIARSCLPSQDDGLLQLNMFHELSAISAVAVLLTQGCDDDLPDCRVALRRLLSSAEATGSIFRSVQCLILQALMFDHDERDRGSSGLARPGGGAGEARSSGPTVSRDGRARARVTAGAPGSREQ